MKTSHFLVKYGVLTMTCHILSIVWIFILLLCLKVSNVFAQNLAPYAYTVSTCMSIICCLCYKNEVSLMLAKFCIPSWIMLRFFSLMWLVNMWRMLRHWRLKWGGMFGFKLDISWHILGRWQLNYSFNHSTKAGLRKFEWILKNHHTCTSSKVIWWVSDDELFSSTSCYH